MSDRLDPAPGVEPTPLERAWAQTRVEAETPTGRVQVSMVGDGAITVRVDPTWYATTSVGSLQDELVRAAKLTYVQRTRRYYETWSDLTGQQVAPIRTARTPKQADFQHRLEQVSALGEAYDGRISVFLTGVHDFRVSIDAGVVDELDARAFGEQVARAGEACLRDHERGWQEAHFEVYSRPKLERAGLL